MRRVPKIDVKNINLFYKIQLRKAAAAKKINAWARHAGRKKGLDDRSSD